MSQQVAAFLRDRVGLTEMSPAEMNRRAHEVVDAIDAETGNRTAHSARVAQLYHVGRQIQVAANLKAKVVTAHKIISYLMLVLARSYGIGLGAR